MAECPNCGSRLEVIQWNFLTNILGLTKPYFRCPICKWKMTVKEVTKRGGLHRIKHVKTKGIKKSKKRYSKRRNSKYSNKKKKYPRKRR